MAGLSGKWGVCALTVANVKNISTVVINAVIIFNDVVYNVLVLWLFGDKPPHHDGPTL